LYFITSSFILFIDLSTVLAAASAGRGEWGAEWGSATHQWSHQGKGPRTRAGSEEGKIKKNHKNLQLQKKNIIAHKGKGPGTATGSEECKMTKTHYKHITRQC
jgi:hypothetical protein